MTAEMLAVAGQRPKFCEPLSWSPTPARCRSSIPSPRRAISRLAHIRWNAIALSGAGRRRELAPAVRAFADFMKDASLAGGISPDLFDR